MIFFIGTFLDTHNINVIFIYIEFSNLFSNAMVCSTKLSPPLWHAQFFRNKRISESENRLGSPLIFPYHKIQAQLDFDALGRGGPGHTRSGNSLSSSSALHLCVSMSSMSSPARSLSMRDSVAGVVSRKGSNCCSCPTAAAPTSTPAAAP